jgi:hypothetical protein
VPADAYAYPSKQHTASAAVRAQRANETLLVSMDCPLSFLLLVLATRTELMRIEPTQLHLPPKRVKSGVRERQAP